MKTIKAEKINENERLYNNIIQSVRELQNSELVSNNQKRVLLADIKEEIQVIINLLGKKK